MHIDKETLDSWDVEEEEQIAFLKAVENYIVIGIAIWIAIGTLAITWAVMSIR